MPIRVLGCSGSIAAGCRTTAFLLDDDVLIDAGTGVGDLTLDELTQVDHILLSHSHLDHVLGVPLLADSVMRRRSSQRQRGRRHLQLQREQLQRQQPSLRARPLRLSTKRCTGSSAQYSASSNSR